MISKQMGHSPYPLSGESLLASMRACTASTAAFCTSTGELVMIKQVREEGDKERRKETRKEERREGRRKEERTEGGKEERMEGREWVRSCA